MVSRRVERSGVVATGVGLFPGTGVGDTDPGAELVTGAVPDGLVPALMRHGDHPVNRYRGLFRCPLCPEATAGGGGPWGPTGSGPFEIHLWADSGQLFVAPNLIVHLVEAHGLRPPDAFIAAALEVAASPARLRRGPIASVLHELATAGDDVSWHRDRLEAFRAALPGTVWYRSGGDETSDGYLVVTLTPRAGDGPGENDGADLAWADIAGWLGAGGSLPGVAFRVAAEPGIAAIEARVSRADLIG